MNINKTNFNDAKLTDLQGAVKDADNLVATLKDRLKQAKKTRRNAKRNVKRYLKTCESIKAQAEAQREVDAMIKELQRA